MDRIIIVNGQPKGKARPRFSTKNCIRAYTDKGTKDYENLVKKEYLKKYNNCMYGKAIRMQVNAFFRIPISTSKKNRELMELEKTYCIKKPDVDNIIKIIADALNNVAYIDDSQICEVTCVKKYSKNPRVEIILSEVEQC